MVACATCGNYILCYDISESLFKIMQQSKIDKYVAIKSTERICGFCTKTLPHFLKRKIRKLARSMGSSSSVASTTTDSTKNTVVSVPRKRSREIDQNTPKNQNNNNNNNNSMQSQQPTILSSQSLDELNIAPRQAIIRTRREYDLDVAAARRLNGG